jgi:hypothetical protein
MKRYPALVLQLAIILLLLLSLSVVVCAQKQKSDRESDRLRGHVKTVQTETAKLSTVDGKLIEGKRETRSVVNYDEAGNLTKVERYEDGTPLETDTYFFLDGDRVYKREVLRQSSKSINGGTATLKPDAKPDPRFTVKLKYKFDTQGNRIEETIITNRDEATARHVYKYDAQGALVADTVYLQVGVNNTSTYKVDDKGNVIEMSRGPDIKIFYTYTEFDEKGNWTKRTVKLVSTLHGKTSESSTAYFRTITYY